MLNSINTNIAAYSAQQNINKANSMAGSSIARLSSGDRITRAADDVAGLSVGTSLRTQVTTLRQALVNSSQGSSLLQVADGALQQVTDILQRQKSIATQAGSGSLTDVERGFLNQEFQALTSEIDRIAGSTNFNGVSLINGGLGISTNLVDTDAQVAGVDFNAADNSGAVAVAGAKAIQAFNVSTGAELNGNAAPGELTFTLADGTTELTNQAYGGVNSAVNGKFQKFELSNVSYGAANVGTADLTATIGGVEFKGKVIGGSTNVSLSNGTTNMLLTFTAIDLTSASTTNVSEAQLKDDFVNTAVYRTASVNGVDFTGTKLEGVSGSAAGAGNSVVRLADANNVSISDFKYVSNAGANTNTLTVQINGSTFTASGVNDAVAAADQISFENGKGEAFMIDLTGLTTGITNIRTSDSDRQGFMSALNTGFSRSGNGLSFAIGSTASDTIKVQIKDSSTNALFGGQALGVATAAAASEASAALDVAIRSVTAARAEVGALQSRFDFAAANTETSIQNQDAARGVLLDTDVAAESTSFASAQVQLQAGISVLAQANLLPQNLLKLIG